MKTNLTADRLIHAINNQLESYTAEDAMDILRNEYRFTDDEIRALGLDYLFDLTEPDEPLDEFRFRYTESWAGVFTVSAHNRDEAVDLFEKTDSAWYPLN